MEIKDLTRYQRRRLNQARKCPVCGNEIMDWHYFVMLKHRHRRCMIYEFVHTKCLGEYSPTTLRNEELAYCINDVDYVMQYIQHGVKDDEKKYISKNICGNRKNLQS